MADDIDTLIDEVETLFHRNEPVKHAPAKSVNTSVPSNKNVKRKDDEIDNLLSELDLLDATTTKSKSLTGSQTLPTTVPSNSSSSQSMSRRRKCEPFIVPACSKTRCLSCDLVCVSFQDKSWVDSVACYLFFRNHYPSESKLSEGLIHKEGHVAMCCQCSWVTVSTKGTDVQNLHCGDGGKSGKRGEKLKWTCAGHE